jgi:hypothetical protein
MALINCAECQQSISDKAASCPHCGAPQNTLETPPPQPSPIQQPTQKTTSQRQFAIYLVAILVGTFVLAQLFVDKKPASQPTAQVSEAAKREADKQQEAQCETDLKCIGDKKSVEATFKCVPYVERLAKNNFEWIDAWYEPKFSHFRWKDQNNLVVTYLGDKIKFQNGFGGWMLSRYECDYNIRTSAVLDVRASAGRMPQ